MEGRRRREDYLTVGGGGWESFRGSSDKAEPGERRGPGGPKTEERRFTERQKDTKEKGSPFSEL